MILSIFRTALINLRRDRAALLLSFVVPIAFFSIFAGIFAGNSKRAATPRVSLAVVDEDHSGISKRVIEALQAEPSLDVHLAPAAGNGKLAQPYSAATAEAAVRNGTFTVALIVPSGFGAMPIGFGAPSQVSTLQLLADSSDPVAPQIVTGMIQKTVMMSMPDLMAEAGIKYVDRWAGGLTPEQRKFVDENIKELQQIVKAPHGAGGSVGSENGGLVRVNVRDILGETKKNPVVAFYAAGLGVMFLLFSASGAGGALLEESESGTLDRVLSSRVTMTKLLLGKLVFLIFLNTAQLVVMFVWGAIAFKLDLWHHLPGFVIMTAATAAVTAAFGLMLASASRTRGQLGALSTLVILVLSAMGGSMFPRFLMSATMQKIGLFTFNAWAIDGFTKVFWRELPAVDLWPQVSVLVAFGIAFFILARRLARRWEIA